MDPPTGRTNRGTAPPLNEYKIDFLRGRLWKTILGGVDLTVQGSVPKSIYFFQLILFFLPMIIGIPFSIITNELEVEGYILSIILGGNFVNIDII